MTFHEDFFPSFDGLRLFEQAWIPDDAQAAVVLVHGSFEHSGRYHRLARSSRSAGTRCMPLTCAARPLRRGEGVFRRF